MQSANSPLANARHEKFCQLLAGAAFGMAAKAYIEAGFSAKNPDVAAACASRLLGNAKVSTRVQWLRREQMVRLAVDALRIAELRLVIAESESASHSDRLTALRDLERMLGLARPEKIAGAMEAVIRFE